MRKIFCYFFGLVFFAAFVPSGWAQEAAAPAAAEQAPAPVPEAAAVDSADLVTAAWKASNSADYAGLDKVYSDMMAEYEGAANSQAAQLKDFPLRSETSNFKSMNSVATVMFVKGEALMRQGKKEEAQAVFEEVSQKYPWAQAFDPSRGNYWSIKEKSQASIRVIKGEAHHEEHKTAAPVMRTVPRLAFPGKSKIVDYTKYGEFLNLGEKNYHYQINDRKGLEEASGEGIYPNIKDIYRDPRYKKVQKEGRLNGSHWDFVNSEDIEAAVYKWITAPEPWGIKLFYLGTLFEKAKMYTQAIKAYHAVAVFYPNTIAWTYWQTPWYPGQAAVAKIRYLIRVHPELRLQYTGAKIRITNSFDNDHTNDETFTNPGIIKRLSPFASAQQIAKAWDKVPLGNPVKTLGQGRVQLVKYDSGHWQMLVEGKPYLIKGITYGPSKVGQSPDTGTLANWMEEDENKNGLVDGPYEAWVDKNRNNKQDPDEPTVGDFAVMKEMGVNTLRLYHIPMKPNKELLRKMYKEYGLRVIMGDYLGKYAIGSGATWSEGTDYENPEHQAKMMENVKQMVEEFKDEPYILMWLLGNENNYGVASNADKKPDAYYKFVNDVAKMIKSIDTNHPVAICNGDTLFLDKFVQHAPDVDAYGSNAYRGNYGFGAFWEQVGEAADRPAFITEYGSPAYSGAGMTLAEAEQAQADYHRGNWLDIQTNSDGYADGVGTSIGGVAFEWVDEWWKNYEPARHDTKAEAVGPFPGGYYYEEWFGLFGQGDGQKSPFLREPRKVFDTYKELWNSN